MRRAAACLLCRGTRARVLFRKGGRDFVRCAACGLVWLDPMPTAAEIGAYYEQSYRDGIYGPYAAAETIRRWIAEHRLAAIRPHARAGRWLDVGAATGHFVETAARVGMAAEGCELSTSAVASARARGLTMHHTAIEDFTPAAPYDTITAFDVLEHLREPRAFLDRLRSWLVPGGTLALTLPDVSSIYPRLMRRHWFYYAPSDHLHYFDPRTITRLLAEHGFAEARVTRAYKPLTLAYIALQLEQLTPALGRVAGVLVRAVPRALRERPVHCYIGEMMVIAHST
jgi:2-polyprenyl-3-methyl-5-hydroxy-6-metoxy-1,4-benzoquinol methylase